MKYPLSMRSAILVAAMGAGAAFAQTSTPTVSDAAPLPPENRSSVGAVVLETSPVRAQKNLIADHAADRASASAKLRAQTAETELARQQTDESNDLRRMGGPPAPTTPSIKRKP